MIGRTEAKMISDCLFTGQIICQRRRHQRDRRDGQLWHALDDFARQAVEDPTSAPSRLI